MSGLRLFEMTPVRMPERAAPKADAGFDERVRRYYAERPAVTPFSRRPVSLEDARRRGMSSACRAEARAWRDVEVSS